MDSIFFESTNFYSIIKKNIRNKLSRIFDWKIFINYITIDETSVEILVNNIIPIKSIDVLFIWDFFIRDIRLYYNSVLIFYFFNRVINLVERNKIKYVLM